MLERINRYNREACGWGRYTLDTRPGLDVDVDIIGMGDELTDSILQEMHNICTELCLMANEATKAGERRMMLAP